MKAVNEYGLRIQYTNFKRAKGPGGQSVNKTSNAYKACVAQEDLPDALAPLFPNGIAVESSSGKSTKANKKFCLIKINKLIARRIAEAQSAAIDSQRRDVDYFKKEVHSEEGEKVVARLAKAKERRIADKRKAKSRRQNRSIYEDSAFSLLCRLIFSFQQC